MKKKLSLYFCQLLFFNLLSHGKEKKGREKEDCQKEDSSQACEEKGSQEEDAQEEAIIFLRLCENTRVFKKFPRAHTMRTRGIFLLLAFKLWL